MLKRIEVNNNNRNRLTRNFHQEPLKDIGQQIILSG